MLKKNISICETLRFLFCNLFFFQFPGMQITKTDDDITPGSSNLEKLPPSGFLVKLNGLAGESGDYKVAFFLIFKKTPHYCKALWLAVASISPIATPYHIFALCFIGLMLGSDWSVHRNVSILWLPMNVTHVWHCVWYQYFSLFFCLFLVVVRIVTFVGSQSDILYLIKSIVQG